MKIEDTILQKHQSPHLIQGYFSFATATHDFLVLEYMPANPNPDPDPDPTPNPNPNPNPDPNPREWPWKLDTAFWSRKVENWSETNRTPLRLATMARGTAGWCDPPPPGRRALLARHSAPGRLAPLWAKTTFHAPVRGLTRPPYVSSDTKVRRLRRPGRASLSQEAIREMLCLPPPAPVCRAPRSHSARSDLLSRM